MKEIPFEDVTPDGLLKGRAELSFRHLQEPYFQWDNISRVNFEPFPGDAIGRTINGLTLLSRALHQPEPASLTEIMRRVPSVANTDGYLGPKLPESRANEDTLAGHNGYACGLAEYVRWTQDPAATESLTRMAANLFGPLRAAVACYRDTSPAATNINWHLSGGDIGQLFLILDGMTRTYALTPTSELLATIETAIDRYRKLDLVGISAQTHAMLSATTGILRWYEMQHRTEDLAFAEALYKEYRTLAMTETYENYNWFNRPQWTEACAVSDSFILTVNLWRLTGHANYLEDAHLILFNGLLPGQLRNGGFGTGPCVGPATGACQAKEHHEAPFCCSMRGGEALARAIQYSYFLHDDTVSLPFYGDNEATLRFAKGTCKVRQKSGYPHKGAVRLEVMESQVNTETKWLFFVPPWAVRNSFEITVNGRKVEPCLANSFAEITVRPVTGTVMEITFQQERGARPAVQSQQAPGACRYFSGPLLLGSATDKAAEPLVPILDLLGPGGSGVEPYAYFPNGKTQPAANAPAVQKTPNLAETAQVFRRDLPTEQLPSEVGKLFGALKQDRTLAICAFAWSPPQNVRQVVLQWPESGAMPKPEAIVLRWSAAGDVHTAAQPGIIGNGRQWVYTLGKAPEGAVVDNLVVAAKSAEGIPEALAVPVVEILGNQSQLPLSDGKPAEPPPPVETKEARDARMAWWRDARFGMFVVVGPYSGLAGTWKGKPVATNGCMEWIQEMVNADTETYAKAALPLFKPKPDAARAWAKLAKTAGCRYIVFTTKFSDGFAMFDSKVSDFDAGSVLQRDIVKEYVDACRAEGLRVGFYHSVIDWHHDQYEYRRSKLLPHPLKGKPYPNGQRDHSKYIDYLHAQVNELMSNYGQVDVLWFDYSAPEFQGQEAWRAFDLMKMVREKQPGIIINNRLFRSEEAGWNMQTGAGGSKLDTTYGDFITPEQYIPAAGMPGVDWETCMTMNTTWGYSDHDHAWKSSEALIRKLIDIASKGGNFLLNIGPKGDGSIPQASIDSMEAIGRWMKVNSDAIYGTSATAFGEELGKPVQGRTGDGKEALVSSADDWRCTTKPGKIYLHLFKWPADGTFEVPPLQSKVTKAYLLVDRKEMKLEQSTQGVSIAVPAEAPDKIASVICLEITDLAPVKGLQAP